MALRNEVQAAVIMVSGEWARYLDETAKYGDYKTTLARLIERYKAIRVELEKVHEQQPIEL
jgi:hypothetical protein